MLLLFLYIYIHVIIRINIFFNFYIGANVGRIDEHLMDLILELLRADLCYTIKRLLPADLKIFANIQPNDNVSFTDNNPFCDEYVITKNEKYGGINVTSFFVYNRLKEIYFIL